MNVNRSMKTITPGCCLFATMPSICLSAGLKTQEQAVPVRKSLVIGNPAETIATQAGPVTLFIPEFSKPTGKYVNKLILRMLNSLVRRGSIVMAGNPCTPGLELLDADEQNTGAEIFSKAPHRTVIMNFRGVNPQQRGIVFQAEPFMQIALRENWNSFDDYLNDMHSKYRVRARKVYSLSEELECHTYRGIQIPDHLYPEIASLLAGTLANKTLALPPNLEQLLRSFSFQYGEHFEVAVYRNKGRNVGFLSRLYLGNKVHAMHIGYDGTLARHMHLYQRMMYDLIDSGIQCRAALINLGRTATEIKSTLGAEPVENSMVIMSRNPLIRQTLRLYKRYMFKPETYVLRHPFKA